jgi:hypothetical protein
MPFVALILLSFSGVLWTLNLLQSKHTETSIWHARPFARTFQSLVCGRAG